MKKLTRKEAKKLSIEKWQYLYDHPSLNEKDDSSFDKLPEDLKEKIKDFKFYCPLCELFGDHNCSGCPLDEENQNCIEYNYDYAPYFDKWSFGAIKTRKKYAKLILDIIKNWKI